MRNISRKIFLKIIPRLVTFFLLFLTFLLIGVRLLGFTPYTILSESMSPTYPLGAVVYVKEVNFNQITKGTPITYILDEDLNIVTHRVIEIDKDKMLLMTKGDANNIKDGKPVHYNNVLGKVYYSLPYLGFFSQFIKSEIGLKIVIYIILINLGLFIVEYFTKAEKTNKTFNGSLH